jgi:hypothetical protein
MNGICRLSPAYIMHFNSYILVDFSGVDKHGQSGYRKLAGKVLSVYL